MSFKMHEFKCYEEQKKVKVKLKCHLKNNEKKKKKKHSHYKEKSFRENKSGKLDSTPQISIATNVTCHGLAALPLHLHTSQL